MTVPECAETAMRLSAMRLSRTVTLPLIERPPPPASADAVESFGTAAVTRLRSTVL
jgi:hypothetical protein